MNAAFIERVKDWTKHQLATQKQPLTIAYLGGEPTLHSEMYDHADEFIEAAKDMTGRGYRRRIYHYKRNKQR